MTKIPVLNKLEYLNCSKCPGLKTIKCLNKLKALDCSNCISLTQISDLSCLENLNCSKCPELIDIYNTKKLQILNCSYTGIKCINNLMTNVLNYLQCSYCPKLTKIQITFDQMRVFTCVDNRTLIHIPSMNKSPLNRSLIQGCPWINGMVSKKDVEKLIKIQRWWKRIILYNGQSGQNNQKI